MYKTTVFTDANVGTVVRVEDDTAYVIGYEPRWPFAISPQPRKLPIDAQGYSIRKTGAN